MASLEALQAALLDSERVRTALKDENEALRNKLLRKQTEDEQQRGQANQCVSAHQPPPGAPLDATLAYLKNCPVHASLGLPVIDPMHFMEWCKGSKVAASATLGRRIMNSTTRADLAHLLAGEMGDADGPFESGRLHLYSQPYLDALELTIEESTEMRKRILTSNNAIVNAFKGEQLSFGGAADGPAG